MAIWITDPDTNPDHDTGKTCLGGCMHCPSASSIRCVLSVSLRAAENEHHCLADICTSGASSHGHVRACVWLMWRRAGLSWAAVVVTADVPRLPVGSVHDARSHRHETEAVLDSTPVSPVFSPRIKTGRSSALSLGVPTSVLGLPPRVVNNRDAPQHHSLCLCSRGTWSHARPHWSCLEWFCGSPVSGCHPGKILKFLMQIRAPCGLRGHK